MPQNTRPDTRICTVSSGDLYQAGDVLQEEAGDFLTRCQVSHLFQPDVSMQDSNDEPVREGGRELGNSILILNLAIDQMHSNLL